MSTESKDFAVDDIISALTGHVVSRRHVAALYDLLGHLLGRPLLTHQLPSAAALAAPFLAEQFPALAAVPTPNWRDVPQAALEAVVNAWTQERIAEFGEMHSVASIASQEVVYDA